jgi:hypothetical protein
MVVRKYHERKRADREADRKSVEKRIGGFRSELGTGNGTGLGPLEGDPDSAPEAIRRFSVARKEGRESFSPTGCEIACQKAKSSPSNGRPGPF